jgi:hypothetical protein
MTNIERIILYSLLGFVLGHGILVPLIVCFFSR